MQHRICTHVAIAIFFIVFCSVAWTANVQKRQVDNTMDALLPKKRPFCNAFTGCGRKRAEQPVVAMNDLEMDLLLDKLSHQILALVHVLEALHARIESNREQQTHGSQTDAQIANFLAERKKRSTNNDDGKVTTQVKLS